MLLEARAFGNFRAVVIEAGKVFLSYVGGIFFRISQVKDEEHSAGLEIAQLQDEEHSGFDGVQLPHRRLLLGRQREILIALLRREAGASIDGLDFSAAKDGETLAGIVDLSFHSRSSFVSSCIRFVCSKGHDRDTCRTAAR